MRVSRLMRFSCLICAITLLPHVLPAQVRGGHASPAAPVPTDIPPTPDFDGFTRKVALQATPEQIAQFQRLRGSTQAARKSAQEVLRYSATSDQDLFHHANPLTNAVDEVLDDNEKFLLSLSTEQLAGLKKHAKRLRKSDSVLGNQNKVLVRGLDHDQIDAAQIAAVVQKLDMVLSDFQSEQLALAAEMGIQSHGNFEPPKSPPDVVLKR